MMMGGSVGRGKFPLELLSDPDKLNTHIQSLYGAVEARNKSAEEHKKAKTEALDTIERLTQKQAEHDDRERKLSERHSGLDALSGQLNAQLADVASKRDELEKEKEEFTKAKQEQERVFRKMIDEALAKDQLADNKHQAAEQKLMSAAQKEDQLERREELLIKREKFIIKCADELRS